MPLLSSRAWLVGLATAVYLTWLLLGAESAIPSLLMASVAIGVIWSRWLAARQRPSGDYWGFVADTWDVHALALLLLLGLVYQQAATEGITSDGCIYFAHLRSLIFDRDFDIAAELEVLRLRPRNHYTVTMGAAVVWAPVYLLIWAADGIGQAAGFWIAPARVLPGLTGAYAQSALITSYVVAAAGLMALHVHLRRQFDRGTLLCASLLAFGATPVAWYAIYEPAMTHAASFGVTAAFLVASAIWIPAGLSIVRGLILGVLFAAIVVIRPQDGLFGVFPLVLAFDAVGWNLARAWQPVRATLLIALGAAPILILQLAFLAALMAAQPIKLVGEGGYLRLSDSHWMDVLFSSWHGFFSWTPIAYIAFVGTFFYFKRNRPWSIAALVVFASMCWISGSARDWSGSWAFGGRRFASMVAALLPGLAVVTSGIRRKPLLLLVPVTIGVIAWNAALMSQVHHGLLPRDEPISFTTMMRQQADVLTEPPLFYPFAFPANAWFAWREGLPINRYDLLSPIPLGPGMALTLDRQAEPFLLDGWTWTDTEPAGEWLVTGSEATLALPLDPPAAPPLSLEIEARTVHAGEPMQAALEVQVNAASMGRATIEPERGTIRFDTATIGPNRRVWRKGYNRLIFRIAGAWPAGSLSSPASESPQPPRRRDRTAMAVQAVRVIPRPVGQQF